MNARSTPVVITLSDVGAADENGVYPVELLKEGEWFYDNPALPESKLKVTKQDIDEFAENYNSGIKGFELPIVGTDKKTPVVPVNHEHSQWDENAVKAQLDEDPTKNPENINGWTKGVVPFKREDGKWALKGYLDFTDPKFKQYAEDGKVRYVSCELNLNWLNPVDGKRYKVIEAVSTTAKPYIKGMRPIGKPVKLKGKQPVGISLSEHADRSEIEHDGITLLSDLGDTLRWAPSTNAQSKIDADRQFYERHADKIHAKLNELAVDPSDLFNTPHKPKGEYGWIMPNGRYVPNGPGETHEGSSIKVIRDAVGPDIFDNEISAMDRDVKPHPFSILRDHVGAGRVTITPKNAVYLELGKAPDQKMIESIQKVPAKSFLWNKYEPRTFVPADEGNGISSLLERIAKRFAPQSSMSRLRSTLLAEDETVVLYEPSGFAKDIADRYVSERGLGPLPSAYHPVDPRAPQIADWYEAGHHDPQNPEVSKSYDALKSGVEDQWNYLKDNGVNLEPWESYDSQPYANSEEMRNDVENNHHLHFFRGGDMPEDHPLAAVHEPTGFTYNDLLRGVHDFFGHAAMGNQFGPTGEENAWMAHRAAFKPEALPALTTETKGQNSWVNSGPHLRVNGQIPKAGEAGFIHPKDRPYAEQKAMATPQEFTHRPDIQLADAASVHMPSPSDKVSISYTPTKVYVRADKKGVKLSDMPNPDYDAGNPFAGSSGSFYNDSNPIDGAGRNTDVANALVGAAVALGLDNLTAAQIAGQFYDNNHETLPSLLAELAYGIEQSTGINEPVQEAAKRIMQEAEVSSMSVRRDDNNPEESDGSEGSMILSEWPGPIYSVTSKTTLEFARSRGYIQLSESEPISMRGLWDDTESPSPEEVGQTPAEATLNDMVAPRHAWMGQSSHRAYRKPGNDQLGAHIELLNSSPMLHDGGMPTKENSEALANAFHSLHTAADDLQGTRLTHSRFGNIGALYSGEGVLSGLTGTSPESAVYRALDHAWGRQFFPSDGEASLSSAAHRLDEIPEGDHRTFAKAFTDFVTDLIRKDKENRNPATPEATTPEAAFSRFGKRFSDWTASGNRDIPEEAAKFVKLLQWKSLLNHKGKR